MPEAGETVDQVAAVGGIGEQFPVLEDMAVEEVSPVPDDVEGISEEEFAEEEAADRDAEVLPLEALCNAGDNEIGAVAVEPAFQNCWVDPRPDVGKAEIKSWTLLLGVLQATGSRRMTRDAYDAMRKLAGLLTLCPDALPHWKGNEAATEERGRSTPVSEAHLLRTAEIMAASPFPHERTIRRMLPKICASLTARPTRIAVEVDLRKSGARVLGRPNRSVEPPASGAPSTVPVDVVLPREWALLDLITDEVWRELKNSTDEAPIISQRDVFYASVPPVDTASLQNKYELSSAGVGQTIFLVSDRVPLCQNVLRSFPVVPGAAVQRSRERQTVAAEIAAMWTVAGAASWKSANEWLRRGGQGEGKFADYTVSDSDTVAHSECADLSADERDLVSCLRAAHAVGKARSSVAERPPRPPTGAQGTSRGRPRQPQQIPVSPIRPGDTLALLRPLHGVAVGEGGEGDAPQLPLSRLLLVNRFWLEEGEARRQLLWVPDVQSACAATKRAALARPDQCPLTGPHASLFESPAARATRPSSSLISDEAARVSVPVEAFHYGEPAPLRGRGAPACSAPASGLLPSGERYFAYRIALYHDGFVYTEGRQASAEGLYMVCLNLPRHRRRCPSAVRVLSLAPPGTNISSVYDFVLNDILDAARHGFDAVTAEGEKVRVFLDLVCVLTDTPAGNDILDVLGHTANAPCHLCRFRRQTRSEVLSRYTGTGTSSGTLAAKRHWLVHRAVRVCASDADLNELGMRTAGKALPLHRYAEKLQALALGGLLPVSSLGGPIVARQFDPYRAVVVAPDHLLCGVFRDSLNAAIAILPSPHHREMLDTVMLCLLEECGLGGTEGELVNAKEACLHSMSMTSMYATTVVAEHALRTTVALQARDDGDGVSCIPSYCVEAFRVVQSAADLVYLFQVPLEETRRDMCAEDHETAFRALVHTHLSRVAALCRPAEGSRRSASGGQLRKRARSNSGRSARAGSEVGDGASWRSASAASAGNEGGHASTVAAKARKSLDKPNLHRLLELSSAYMPSMGHGSFLSELMFEAAHQALKRALERANKAHLPHNTALRHVLINDLKGRLAGLEAAARLGDEAAVRGCVRLLLGAEASDACAASHSAGGDSIPLNLREAVSGALGPEALVSEYLRSEGRRVLSADPYDRMRRGQWQGAAHGGVLSPETSAPQVGAENVTALLRSDRAYACNILERGDVSVEWLSPPRLGAPGAVWRFPGAADGDGGEKPRGRLAFLDRIAVGSIVACNCLDAPGASSADGLEFHRPFVHLVPASGNSNLTGERSRGVVMLWCVTAVYASGRTASGERGRGLRGGEERPEHKRRVSGYVVRPCEYADTGDAVILRRERWSDHSSVSRSRPLRVCISPESKPLLIRSHTHSRVLEPVAVLHDCTHHTCSLAGTAAVDRRRVVAHERGTTPLEGGQFLFRDRNTGFPPRAA